MSRHEYEVSRELDGQGWSFYALLMAAMRQADGENEAKLREAFPDTWAELQTRYDAPGGLLECL